MKNIMMNLTSRLLALLAIGGLFIISACSDDEGGPTQTVWEILESREDLSQLASELEAAGLADMFNDPSADITLFAPNNAALNSLLGLLGQEDFSNVSPVVVDDVLTFHVVGERLTQSEVNGTLTTEQGEDITVTDGALSSGASSNSNIILSIEATNGIIHVVSAVLLPPSYSIIADAIGTSAQVILLGADFTTFAAAIQKVDATKTNPAETITGALLTMETTVFAVPNQVFEGAGITVGSYTAEEWESILRKHIVVGQLIEPLPADDTFTAMNGTTELVIDGDATPPTVNQVPIVVNSKQSLTSGVVYPIGAMIQ